jgi:hypothetical protein
MVILAIVFVSVFVIAIVLIVIVTVIVFVIVKCKSYGTFLPLQILAPLPCAIHLWLSPVMLSKVVYLQ